MATAAGLVLREFDHFDQHAFAGRRFKAVSKETGIAFNDFGRMHIVRREPLNGRWTVPPAWSQNDIQFREVTLRFLEARFFIRYHDGTNEERLARIQAAAVRRIPCLERNLKGLLARYNEQAGRNYPAAALSKLATQIQNMDAQICMHRRGIAAVVTSFAYMHFRLIHQSTQIAEALGVKPPMVRIWAHRMALIGREVIDGVPRPARRHQKRQQRLASARQPSPVRSKFVVMSPTRLRVTLVGYPKYNKQEFFDMRKAGCTIQEICRVTGASYAYVWKCLHHEEKVYDNAK